MHLLLLTAWIAISPAGAQEQSCDAKCENLSNALGEALATEAKTRDSLEGAEPDAGFVTSALSGLARCQAGWTTHTSPFGFDFFCKRPGMENAKRRSDRADFQHPVAGIDWYYLYPVLKSHGIGVDVAWRLAEIVKPDAGPNERYGLPFSDSFVDAAARRAIGEVKDKLARSAAGSNAAAIGAALGSPH